MVRLKGGGCERGFGSGVGDVGEGSAQGWGMWERVRLRGGGCGRGVGSGVGDVEEDQVLRVRIQVLVPSWRSNVTVVTRASMSASPRPDSASSSGMEACMSLAKGSRAL